ncbi:unnamed protein product [Adineta steineri]|uniref:Uncharacterized protein n=1 Tax=Adineta steineri TaxID=433720 RepID=A0A816AKD1_9BILA|nr:unnamed protein product [Adineta steineri]CAF1597407.1 unnamed protein product [Adineta steineri]
MLAVIIPLAGIREGQQLLYQLHLLNRKTFSHIGVYIGLFGSSALLAFCLEFSEFLLVSNTSSLTLSVSGIFKKKKHMDIDPVVTERLLLRRLESVDEWSIDGETNMRRTHAND